MAKRLWRHIEARRRPGSNIDIEVTATLKDQPYSVAVAFRPNDVDMAYEPVSIQVFRNDGAELSPREVQKLPLGHISAATRALVRSPGLQRALLFRQGEPAVDLSKIDAAAPRPKSRFADPQEKYEAFAEIYRHMQAHPEKWPAGANTAAQAVALKLRMPRGTVDWMKHRARTRYGIAI